MSFHKKTVRDIDVKGKAVLVRVDYNVPMNDGVIQSDFRIRQSLPTLKYLLEQHSKIILVSHLGRPDGQFNKRDSLQPAAKRLEVLLEHEVRFVDDCLGDEVESALKTLPESGVLMLENVRFYPGEEKNDPEFAKKLSTYADVLVQDCFGAIHRAHASIVGVAAHLPAVAGLLLEKEVDILTGVMENPERPLMAIVGGAKIADKIEVINRLIEIADFVAIGGAMANTFLLAQGIKVGKSLVDSDELPLAKDILEKAHQKSANGKFVFYIPQDGVVAHKIDKSAQTRIVDWGAHMIADIESYPKNPPHSSAEVADDEMILDIGPFSGSFIAGGMQLARTVVWNGAMGVTEVDSLHGPVGPFAHGTELIIEAMLGEHGSRPFSVVGGGDTVGYLEERKLTDHFDHVSSGGGASLELMAGKELPGIKVLQDK